MFTFDFILVHWAEYVKQFILFTPKTVRVHTALYHTARRDFMAMIQKLTTWEES